MRYLVVSIYLKDAFNVQHPRTVTDLVMATAWVVSIYSELVLVVLSMHLTIACENANTRKNPKLASLEKLGNRGRERSEKQKTASPIPTHPSHAGDVIHWGGFVSLRPRLCKSPFMIPVSPCNCDQGDFVVL